MSKAAIIIPAGSGKTTLSKKYTNLYDIDSFHNKEDIINLNKLYKEVVVTQDWEKYNKYEISLIKNKIDKLVAPYIILLHCKEKADLLNIKIIGSCKTSKVIMEEVAITRGKENKLREQMTRNNWKYTNGIIFNSHSDLEKYVLDLAKKNKIIV